MRHAYANCSPTATLGGNFRWKLSVADPPADPSAYAPDEMERYMRPKEEKKVEDEGDSNQEEKRGPKPTDWRWGPAQYW